VADSSVSRARGGGIPLAKAVKPTDDSTSIVIDPTGPQIQVGQTKLSTYSNVVYSTTATGSMSTAFTMDIQLPKMASGKPLVVFITGGGFVIAQKTANLRQRTYVAERGYAVASICYRTSSMAPPGATPSPM